MRGGIEGQFLCLRGSGNADMYSRITQMTPPKPLLSILTPVGLTQISAAHCMVSTQDLNRAAPLPLFSLTRYPLGSPMCLSQGLQRKHLRQTQWRRSSRRSLRSPVLPAHRRLCLPRSVVCFSSVPQVHICGLCACVDSSPLSLAALRLFRAWHSLGEIT